MNQLSWQSRINDILKFWFGSPTDETYGQYRKAWFIKDAQFDEQIRQQFLSDVERASAGEYDDWLMMSESTPESAVALLLLLDQFPRNLYRGDARSFATDAQALAVAQHLVDAQLDQQLMPAQRFFVYVPFEHSEQLVHQDRCVALMRSLNEAVPGLAPEFKSGLDYAIRHRDVIERFGRFPHRNEILGRESTPEELAFLQQPGSRF